MIKPIGYRRPTVEWLKLVEFGKSWYCTGLRCLLNVDLRYVLSPRMCFGSLRRINIINARAPPIYRVRYMRRTVSAIRKWFLISSIRCIPPAKRDRLRNSARIPVSNRPRAASSPSFDFALRGL
jgi:hypothetical protein